MYHPIDHYGVIGNMRSAALISPRGGIDWLCLPRFDSPSIFGSILDDTRGGSFEIFPESGALRTSRYYLPDTNVFVSRYRIRQSIAEVVDFMPVPVRDHATGWPSLIRLIRGEQGEMEFKLRCRPAFDYARASHRVSAGKHGAVFESAAVRLIVDTPISLTPGADGEVTGTFTVRAGESTAVKVYSQSPDEQFPLTEAQDPQQLLADTIAYWRRWISRCSYRGRWEERVHRSALALKLLTYEPTGAIVAAPTTSLPELVGGTRNWDYRYTWLRDAAFTVYAFLRIGFPDEAAGFMRWLQQRSHELEPNGRLRPLYTVEGKHQIPEEELLHLDGYMGSKPVRIGNAAVDQIQLDVPGAVMDAAYLHNKHATPLSYDMWREIERLLEWTCNNWRKEDEGVWEVRGKPQHFTFSKLMCWVALDRGVRLALARSFPGDHQRWRDERDKIYREIMERAWDPASRSFVQAYGTDQLDAAVLIMPLVFFIAPNDPRFLNTIEAMRRPLSKGGLVNDLLVYRYNFSTTDDGLSQPEGGFNMCTLWLIEALTRAGTSDPRRLEEARVLFDRLLDRSGPFDLYSEQTSDEGLALGNYPQGFSHLAFISAAYNLDKALRTRR